MPPELRSSTRTRRPPERLIAQTPTQPPTRRSRGPIARKKRPTRKNIGVQGRQRLSPLQDPYPRRKRTVGRKTQPQQRSPQQPQRSRHTGRPLRQYASKKLGASAKKDVRREPVSPQKRISHAVCSIPANMSPINLSEILSGNGPKESSMSSLQMPLVLRTVQNCQQR